MMEEDGDNFHDGRHKSITTQQGQQNRPEIMKKREVSSRKKERFEIEIRFGFLWPYHGPLASWMVWTRGLKRYTISQSEEFLFDHKGLMKNPKTCALFMYILIPVAASRKKIINRTKNRLFRSFEMMVRNVLKSGCKKKIQETATM